MTRAQAGYMEEPVGKTWLTIREAARHIGMSVAFLRKSVRLRSVPHTRVGAKALRFNREALDAWLSANGCGGEINYSAQDKSR